jgi:hypothetical protein
VIVHLVELVLKMIDLEELVIWFYWIFIFQSGSVALVNFIDEIRSL